MKMIERPANLQVVVAWSEEEYLASICWYTTRQSLQKILAKKSEIQTLRPINAVSIESFVVSGRLKIERVLPKNQKIVRVDNSEKLESIKNF